ncbi:MAG: hypothetical protein IPF99_23715 [Deltaproteobacteria bacterium]|nr:hypothetical protein [Deltaproteobacteria bacterium]
MGRFPHRRLTAAALALALLSAGAAAQAQPSPPSPVAAAAAADESVGRSAAELDAMLGRLTDGSARERRAAADEIIRTLEREDIPVIRQRLLAPWRADIEPLRFKIVRLIRAATDNRPNAEYDLLALMLAAPRAADLDGAIERVVLARALGGMASADAGRALVALSSSYGALLRQEVGRIVRGQLRDYVLPALIELRNPSEMMRVFMRQTREALRKVTPGEAVQQHDNALLAEILRAYGSIRQPDAMQVVVSFVNSDRAQVREAARWAVTQYGRESINALRAAYEMYEGHDANPQWGWERTAQELYLANDRRRMAEVTQRLDAGLAAGRSGDGNAMLAHFRWVLARHPDMQRRAEMVEPLMRLARELESESASRAQAVWRLALWVEPEGAHAREIRAAVLFLDAEQSMARGVADPELYDAVLRVDPGHARARAQRSVVAQDEVLRARRHRRTLGAVGLLGVALGTLWLLVRRPPRRASKPAKAEA